MKYKVIDEVDLQEWQEVANGSPSATFFHTPLWSGVFCKTFSRWKVATIGIEFEDGTSAIVPMFRRALVSGAAHYWHEFSVPGAYGGPISNQPIETDHSTIINNVLGKYANILITGNPFGEWKGSDDFAKLETFTHVIQLNGGFSQVRKKFSKGRRAAITYAERMGISVRETKMLDVYREYYEIYKDQIQRWGKDAGDYYPVKLFLNLALVSSDEPGIKLWAAYLDGKMIGGLLGLYHQRHVAIWHGATLSAYLKVRPVDILYATVIEHACKAGYQYFDFGKSGGHQGVAAYKEHFGAIRFPLAIYRRRNIGGLVYRFGRHLKNLQSRCPED